MTGLPYFTYYVKKAPRGLYELRQTRYIGQNHPHDVCALARDLTELRNMIRPHFPGDSIDWSAVEEGSTPSATTPKG